MSCKGDIKQEGQELKLVVECRACKDGEAGLDHEKCFSGVLGAWSSGFGADSIVLSGTVETQYSGEVVDLFQKVLVLKGELGRLSRGSPLEKIPKDKRRICSKCEISHEMTFGDLEKAIVGELSGFYLELRKRVVKVSDAEVKMEECNKCISTIRDALGFVLTKFEDLLGFVIRSGFSVVMRPTKDRKDSRIGQGSKVLKPGLGPDADLISRIRTLEGKFNKTDPSALKRTFERGVSRILARNKQIRPGFAYSWVSPEPPQDAKKVVDYVLGDSRVALYNLPDEVEGHYHITPFEYSLPKEHAELLHLAKDELLEHSPPQFAKMVHAQTYVKQKGLEILTRLAHERGVALGKGRTAEAAAVDRLTRVLARYTAGFGISELFLLDPFIQDIYIDAPAHKNPIYVTINHSNGMVREKCITNVRLGGEDVESLLSRFRYESGRPFSEARPHLEHDLELYNTRVTVIGKPLSPGGIAIALRRHSTEPWTLPRLISAKSMDPFTAGLISFLIDGRSTILIAGGRGAGKTSILGAIMLEFPKSQRILTIEDTMELPSREMQELGYKVQSMMVQSSLGGLGELSADEALRVSLRLGESAIVLGEVRGQEVKTLYEAMRTGTAGSSVLGTIHGNSSKAVFDRVVHDLGIPAKSFAATDIVIVAGLRRPFGSQRQVRRVVEISEFDPDDMKFTTLMEYDEKQDKAVPTDGLRTSRKLREIGGSWGLGPDEIMGNIELRGNIRRTVMEFVEKGGSEKVLDAGFVARSNNAFWSLVEKHGKDYKSIEEDWGRWFAREAKKVS